MKLETVKDKIPALKGVKISANVVDKNVRSLTITDADGNFIVIESAETYSLTLRLLTKAAPAVQKFYTVFHKIGDSEYSKEFTDRHDAVQFTYTLDGMGIEHRMEESEREVSEESAAADDLPF